MKMQVAYYYRTCLLYTSTYFNIYKTIIITVLTVIQTIFTTVWNAIKTVVITVVTAVQAFLTTAWNAIQTVISTVLNTIQSIVTSVWNGIRDVVTTVMNTVGSIISVSYTHLDVYKRQVLYVCLCARAGGRGEGDGIRGFLLLLDCGQAGKEF